MSIRDANKNTGIICAPNHREIRIRNTEIGGCWRRGRKKGSPSALMGNVKWCSCCGSQQ